MNFPIYCLNTLLFCTLAHRLSMMLKILFTVALDITIKAEYWAIINKNREAVYFLYQEMLFPFGSWNYIQDTNFLIKIFGGMIFPIEPIFQLIHPPKEIFHAQPNSKHQSLMSGILSRKPLCQILEAPEHTPRNSQLGWFTTVSILQCWNVDVFLFLETFWDIRWNYHSLIHQAVLFFCLLVFKSS